MHMICRFGKSIFLQKRQHVFRRASCVAFSAPAALPAFDFLLLHNARHSQPAFSALYHSLHKKQHAAAPALHAKAICNACLRFLPYSALHQRLVASHFCHPFQISCRYSAPALYPRQRCQRLHDIHRIPPASGIPGNFSTKPFFERHAGTPQAVLCNFFHRMPVQTFKENLRTAGTQSLRNFRRTARCRPNQAEIRRQPLLKNFMDIQRDVRILAAVIAALKPRHTVLQHLQQLVHLQWVKLPDFIYEQYAAVCLTDRPRPWLWNTRLPQSASPLIYRIMYGAHQRVGNVSFVKLQCRCVQLHKFRPFPKGRLRSAFCLLQNQPRRRSLAYPRRAINQDMLRIRAAERGSERADSLFLPDDFRKAFRACLFCQRLCQAYVPHPVNLFQLAEVFLHKTPAFPALPPAAAVKIVRAHAEKEQLCRKQ